MLGYAWLGPSIEGKDLSEVSSTATVAWGLFGVCWVGMQQVLLSRLKMEKRNV